MTFYEKIAGQRAVLEFPFMANSLCNFFLALRKILETQGFPNHMKDFLKTF